jgi:hypothetical protein
MLGIEPLTAAPSGCYAPGMLHSQSIRHASAKYSYVGRLLCIAAICAFTAAGCSAARKQPLAPGYYVSEYPQAGIERRIVITAGMRRASYDIWRVSPSGDGTALHSHFDLIASDEVPSSGTFAVTQEGSDCGTLSIEPYAPPESNIGAIVVRRGVLGIEHFALATPEANAAATDLFDAQMSREIAQMAATTPQLYSKLSFFYKFVYGELTPQCQFD